MRMLKKFTAIFLTAVLLFSFSGCGGSKTVTASAKFIAGSPNAPGDFFELELSDANADAPVISGASRQAAADDSIIVTGEGLSTPNLKAYIYSQSKSDNGKAYEAKVTVVDDNEITVVIGNDIQYGVYGVYVEANGKRSNTVLVNNPKIWWIGFKEVTVGDRLNIYGENLTTDNKDKSHVYLLDGDSYCETEVLYADSYKVTIEIPQGLKNGKQYGVMLHNGHGGNLCFATAEEKIVYVDKKTTDMSEGKVIDVTQYGASPEDDDNDDSIAVQNAVNAANDGDIIYFPNGTYKFDNAVSSIVGLHFKGEDTEKTIFKMGDKVVTSMFNLSVGPCEFSNISFSYIISGGKLTSHFISFKGDSAKTDFYNLYIHNCKFQQATSAAATSWKPIINAENVDGVWITHNDVMATALLFANNCENIIVEENTCYGTCYVGPYYNQNFFLLWANENVDVSNNYFASADVISDITGLLEKGDFTIGRTFALQFHNYNIYITNNTIDTAGLPNDNAGEQIMFEGVSVKYEGEIRSSTDTVITLPDEFTAQLTKGDAVTVIDGKGVSQWREVKSVKGREVTLNEPWIIIPDEKSTLVFTDCFKNIAIHNNDISGYKNYKSEYTATTAVQAYGGINNMYITSNKIRDMWAGMCITTHYRYSDKPEATNGIFWSVISDNTIQNTGVGILMNLNMIPDTHNRTTPPKLLFGTSVRKNNISYSMDYEANCWTDKGGMGISVGRRDIETNQRVWPGEWAWGNVIENNNISNSQRANIMLWKHQAKTILRNNSVTGKLTDVFNTAENAEQPIIVG